MVVRVVVLFATLGLSATQARDFKIVGNADQTQQIEQSLAACPSLDAKFNSLAKSTGFQQIRVTTSDETKRARGPFLAAISGNEIILAADWLAIQKVPFFDVRHAGEILPDNLCFDLGHLSDHIANPVPKPGSSANIQTWVDERLKAESKAFIRGWPLVLEAARIKNGDKPLTGAQVGDLLINLRYRFAFLKAMSPKASPRLTILNDGTIPETDANIAAVATVLAQSSVADLE